MQKPRAFLRFRFRGILSPIYRMRSADLSKRRRRGSYKKLSPSLYRYGETKRVRAMLDQKHISSIQIQRRFPVPSPRSQKQQRNTDRKYFDAMRTVHDAF
jgi:hypothetical protein